MFAQSVEPAFQSTTWLDFFNYWTCTKRTLAEKLEKGDLSTINVVSTVLVTYQGSILSINWDGTSKIAYRGQTQSTIAGKPITTDMWEILLKKENITELDTVPQTLWLSQYNVILTNRTIELSAYAWTPKEVLVKAHTATCVVVGDNFSLFLELPRPPSE